MENETLRFWILENDRANLYLEAGRQERFGFDDAPWSPRQYAANLAALTGRVVYIAGMKDGSPWAGANLPVRRPSRDERTKNGREWTRNKISTLKWPADTVIGADETGEITIYCPA